ncbi:hypothetical protein C8J56DRAFT_1058354 [Mycena floridula]|nr:hypothetical protein C8J56DRAFT_1058354 [Mycena floridula]
MFTTIQFDSSMLKMLRGSDKDNDIYPLIAKARETIESQQRVIAFAHRSAALLTPSLFCTAGAHLTCTEIWTAYWEKHILLQRLDPFPMPIPLSTLIPTIEAYDKACHGEDRQVPADRPGRGG